MKIDRNLINNNILRGAPGLTAGRVDSFGKFLRLRLNDALRKVSCPSKAANMIKCYTIGNSVTFARRATRVVACLRACKKLAKFALIQCIASPRKEFALMPGN